MGHAGGGGGIPLPESVMDPPMDEPDPDDDVGRPISKCEATDQAVKTVSTLFAPQLAQLCATSGYEYGYMIYRNEGNLERTPFTPMVYPGV